MHMLIGEHAEPNRKPDGAYAFRRICTIPYRTNFVKISFR
jgi:hypothetical protein